MSFIGAGADEEDEEEAALGNEDGGLLIVDEGVGMYLRLQMLTISVLADGKLAC